MIVRRFLAFVAGMLWVPGLLLAQQEENPGFTDTAVQNRFWQVSFCDGGHYMVRLDRIASVSRHRYVLDGKVIVDEVVVDTTGQALARFYFLEPITSAMGNDSVQRIAERGKELLDQASARSGSEIHNMVVKTYPGTTHAKMVEYRLTSLPRLEAVHRSVQRAWENGQGRSLNVVQTAR